MNKRSLIFIFLMTIALFFVNQWLSSKRQEESSLAKKQQEQSEELVRKKEQEISARIANIKEFHTVKLYSDANLSEWVGWAIVIDQAYLTLAWTEELPETIYISENKGEALTLSIKAKKLNAPALYTKGKEEKLDVANLPYTGLVDVQLLSFSKKGVDIHLGEYENGALYFPKEYPKSNAFVFYKLGNRYLPVGFYQAKNKQFKPVSSLPKFESFLAYQAAPLPKEISQEESYYVIENGYQQIVFSNIGGSIVEINLPFQSESLPKSVVRPIAFDKTIVKQYPNNAFFPNYPYYQTDSDGKAVLMQPKKGGYYPLLRRDIKKGPYNPPNKVPPKFYALNTVSEYPEMAQVRFVMKQFGKDFIEFEAVLPQRRIVKRFSFPKEGIDAPYCIEMSIRVEGDSRGLYLTSGVPEVELISNNPAPVLKYRTTQNQKSVVEKVSLPKHSFTFSTMQPDWICNSNGFFGLILDPLNEIDPGFKANAIPGELDPTRISIIDKQHNLYPANKYTAYEMLLPLSATSQSKHFRFFAGPFDNTILKEVDNAFTDPITGYNPNYIACQSFHGWFSFISEPFAKFLFLIMNLFYKATHSWGFAIILLTVVLRVMLYPLNAWSIKSTVKMQAVAPQVKAIQDRYKKDPKRSQMEIMQLYRKNGVNPFTGCIPLLIQMPFLIGMFDLLKSTFQLRGVTFIPGWIDNLTAPDVIFSWKTPIIFFGTGFHLLPFILGAVMFIQQKFTTMQSKANLSDTQKQQQKMGTFMTIIFTVMFYNFPSGLNIYWLSSMSLAILQQWFTAKRYKLKPVPVKKR